MNPYSTAHRNIHSDTTMMKYKQIPEFNRDFKKLEKQYPTLGEDFEKVKKYAIDLSHLTENNNQSIKEIKGAGNSEDLQFYKVRKFACRS